MLRANAVTTTVAVPNYAVVNELGVGLSWKIQRHWKRKRNRRKRLDCIFKKKFFFYLLRCYLTLTACIHLSLEFNTTAKGRGTDKNCSIAFLSIFNFLTLLLNIYRV